ncbi:MAG: hypothetical protein AAF730_17295 [Bacteroidota bacterium]
MEIVPIFSTVFMLLIGVLYLAPVLYLLYCIHRLRVEAEAQTSALLEIKELLRHQAPRG